MQDAPDILCLQEFRTTEEQVPPKLKKLSEGCPMAQYEGFLSTLELLAALRGLCYLI